MFPQTSWFLRLNRPPRPKSRLFLFPYAGGSASLFRDWRQWAGDGVELVGVQLPGRERRFNDHLIKRVELAVNEIFEEITKCFDLPFSLFGHSNGAILAFELAGRLEREARRAPDCLIVSGRKSPALAESRKEVHRLPDALFIQELRALEGTPPAVFDDPSILEVLLPMLRADFEMTETYHYSGCEPLKCPIAAFGGNLDRYVTERDIRDWSTYTTGQFVYKIFNGGHFFLHDRQAELVCAVLQVLSGDRAAFAACR